VKEIIRNMPASIYHSTKALSKSGLDELRRSPAHFRAWQDGVTNDVPTPAMELGTAVHMAILEPDLFPKSYAVFKGDRRTKEGKAAYESAIEAGFTPLTQEQWDNITGAAAAVHAHPAIAPLLQGIETEVSCFDVWNGVKVKARVDGLAKDYIIDIKTTQDASPNAFGKSCAQFRYHVQAAWYRRITGINRFILIAVEKEAPYGVACYELDEAAIALGNTIIDEQLKTYIECDKLNSWPCYSSQIQSLSLPSWASRQSEQL